MQLNSTFSQSLHELVNHLPVDISSAAVREPVSFKAPHSSISTDVDEFIKYLHSATSHSPNSRALIIVHDLKAFVEAILPNIQTVTQT